jgi:hypothetical protein
MSERSCCMTPWILAAMLVSAGRTVLPAAAQSHARGRENATPEADTGFAALQERGKRAMGVDQYTSVHHFIDTPKGGRIVFERDSSDSTGVAAIRLHLKHITSAFSAGDFQLPGMVHAQKVPGTAVMAARHTAIQYDFRSLAGGGEVRIRTQDAEALRAVHAFLAFQRREHRVEDDTHRH